MDSKYLKELPENIIYALSKIGLKVTEAQIERELNSINTLDDVNRYDADRNHILWFWLPAIIFAKFGFEIYHNRRWENICCDHSFVMLHPCFLSKKLFLQQLLERHFSLSAPCIKAFTPKFISVVYGGFPWFRAYYMACEKHNVFENGKAVIWKVTSPTTGKTDVIREMIDFKNTIRQSVSSEIREEFAGEKFPGIIKLFHSPSHIEVKRFEAAVESTNL